MQHAYPIPIGDSLQISERGKRKIIEYDRRHERLDMKPKTSGNFSEKRYTAHEKYIVLFILVQLY